MKATLLLAVLIVGILGEPLDVRNERQLSSSVVESSTGIKKRPSASMFAIEAAPDFTIVAKSKPHNSQKERSTNISRTLQKPIADKLIPKIVNLTSINSTLSTNIESQLNNSTKTTQINTVKPGKATQLFYMYDLDESFWWRWPANGTDCSENGYVGHEHAMYSGMGPPILPDDGLFLTWHFSLFSSLYNRMKRSSRRTLDPELASLFIIPYDLGLDGYLSADNCRNRRSCSRGLVDKLTKTLDQSKYFQRHQGGDHAVLWSLGQYHPWPREKCDIFMKDYCARCTFTCYWMDPTKADNRFVSVPFPSGYHYHDEIKNLPWDLNLAPKRNLTAVYLGSTLTLNPAHTKIRRAMTAQCNVSSECHWLQIGHNSKDNNIADFLSVYKRSVFCLCPPGDDPARKAVFDAIISGCIPVIFEVATLYNQYPWHIGEQAALDISVSIPGGQVRSGKLDFMKVLLAISPEVIRKKQEALTLIAPRVQYAIPPIERLKDRYDTTTWDPPFPDGVEITLDGLFERTGHIIRNESTGIPHRLITGREWAQEYDVIKVQVPKGLANMTSGAKSETSTVSTDTSSSELQSKQDHDIKAASGKQNPSTELGATGSNIAGSAGKGGGSHKHANGGGGGGGHRGHHNKAGGAGGGGGGGGGGGVGSGVAAGSGGATAAGNGGGTHRTKHSAGGGSGGGGVDRGPSAFGAPGEAGSLGNDGVTER